MRSMVSSSPARRFLCWFLSASALCAVGLGLFIALLDPYGVSPIRLPIARPIMDINQRFMYPQVVRRHVYDSAVFGTSTARLLDPEQLNSTFGGHFANLAMNAATPWEQMKLADLFLRETRHPKTVVFGIDPTWCMANADKERLTFRAFPESFYDDNRWNDLGHLFNMKTLEITIRLTAFHLKRAKARIREDGYEVFVGDDARYDVTRARQHIWAGNPARQITPVEPPVVYSDDRKAALSMPALGWLQAMLTRIPKQSRVLLVFPPVHIAVQSPPGSEARAQETVCHARVAEIAKQAGATLVDMRFENALTREDSHYWDPMHYRITIAPQIIDALRQAESGILEGDIFRVIK